MGIGLVIVFWFVAACIGAAVLGATAWLISRRQPAQFRTRRALLAAAYPFGVLAWVIPAGMLWVGWGALTGLHAQFGLGDSWEVALPSGYTLGFVDVGDRASIYPPQGVAAVVPDVTRIAVVGNRAFGVASEGAFVLDVSSGRLQRGEPSVLFTTNGLDGSALLPVGQYPGRAQNALDILILVAIFIGPPSVVAWHTWSRRLTAHGAERP